MDTFEIPKSVKKTTRKTKTKSPASSRTRRRTAKSAPSESKKILICASEAVPFVKSGGLADVCGALARTLKQLGHDVRLVLPRYWSVSRETFHLTSRISPMGVQMGHIGLWCEVLEGTFDGIPAYFIEHEKYFGRAGLYDDGRWEYRDNAERFSFFSKAVLQMCLDLNFQPDIIHCNDWQTALVPAYLKLHYANHPFFEKTSSVFSIHNIAYQGVFPKKHYGFLGFSEEHFADSKMESFGDVHFMKAALFYADAINTVSPSYAEEVLSEPGANGLSEFIQRRRDDFFGILNGADYDHWDPETDKLIPAKFSHKSMAGKAVCKKELQKEFMVEQNEKIPVFGIIARFAQQKGLEMLAMVIHDILRYMAVQFVILGSGEKHLEDFYGALPAVYSGRVGAWIGYNDYKAHLIEAGSDFFVMPSLFEPCGLNQIYSMKYGTLPVVRETGGLKDTVRQYDELKGTGTGFRFRNADASALYNTIGWAVSTYYDRPQHIQAMRLQAMKEKFCWSDSGKQYEKLYEHAASRRASWH